MLTLTYVLKIISFKARGLKPALTGLLHSPDYFI